MFWLTLRARKGQAWQLFALTLDRGLFFSNNSPPHPPPRKAFMHPLLVPPFLFMGLGHSSHLCVFWGILLRQMMPCYATQFLSLSHDTTIPSDCHPARYLPRTGMLWCQSVEGNMGTCCASYLMLIDVIRFPTWPFLGGWQGMLRLFVSMRMWSCVPDVL